MHFGRIVPIIAFLLVFSGMALAVPGIPHQFYGYVTINQVPADGANIVAKINDVEKASTVSLNGNYGFAPSIFYVPDPNSTNQGKTIDFYLNDNLVASHAFSNGETTRLDLILGDEPFCGDGYCNLDEDGDSCAEDCAPEPVCGDSVCDAEEDCSSCSEDCGACPPICGDGACSGGETCSTCATDCGACGGPAPSGGGPSGGPSGGGGAPKLNVKIEGSCIGQPVEVTVTNTVGNPAENATVKVLKDMKSIAEERTGETGIVSFTFEEEGSYTFYVTKNLYTQNTKTVSLGDCPEGSEPESGEETVGAENLCLNVDCDDDNPCTTEYCVAGTGHCSYSNQVDGTACAGGACLEGACELPVEEQQVQPVSGTVGFFGLNSGQSTGLGIVILGLIGLLALLGARGKRKKKK